MTLYHFCAAHMVTRILLEGLTLGKYPLISGSKVNCIEPCQWLTTEPDADKQSWVTCHVVPYTRTAYRLTIQIPDGYQKLLSKASEFELLFKGAYDAIVDGWEGSDSWYIYLGRIPPEWIKASKRTEGRTQAGRGGTA